MENVASKDDNKGLNDLVSALLTESKELRNRIEQLEAKNAAVLKRSIKLEDQEDRRDE